MPHAPPDDDALIRALEARFGLGLNRGLHRKVQLTGKALVAEGISRDIDEVARRLADGRDNDPVVTRMREVASIGETWFFRTPEQLDALVRLVRTRVLPFVGKRRTLRLWSAACATGEEAYTLAVLFRRAFPAFDITVTGTDMNAASLARARAGLYSPRAFRRSRVEPPADAFERQGDGWAVLPSVRRAVRFTQLNLVTDGYPHAGTLAGSFDVVVCRNVLIYLDPRRMAEVMRKIQATCAPHAVVALTPAEHVAASHLHGFTREPHALFIRAGISAVPTAPSPAHLHRAPPAPVAQPAAPSPGFDDTLSGALAAADRGDSTTAERLLAAAERARPEAPEPPYVRALLHQARGDAASAEREFRRSLFLDGAFLPALLGLASERSSARSHAAASSHYRRALKLLEALPDDALLPYLGITAEAARGLARAALARGEDRR